jgi:hypothetical protein
MINQVIFALNFVRNIILCLGLVYAIATARHFWKKDLADDIMRMKKPIFILLAVAMVFFTLGFLFINPYELPGEKTFTLMNTFFFTVSYAAFISALAIFWHNAGKRHKLDPREGFYFIAVLCGVIIWLHYLFESSLIPSSISQPFYKQLLFMIHPLAVSLIFLLTLGVSPRHRAKIIRAPLLYISSGIFFYFIGYMMLVDSLANPSIAALLLLNSIIFLISAIYLFLGFFSAEEIYKRSDAKKA